MLERRPQRGLHIESPALPAAGCLRTRRLRAGGAPGKSLPPAVRAPLSLGRLGRVYRSRNAKAVLLDLVWGAWGACSKPSRIARARAHDTVLEFGIPAPSAPTAPSLAGPSIRPWRGRASAPAWSCGTAACLTRRHFAGYFASGDSAPIRVQAPGGAPLPDAAGGARALRPADAACVRRSVRSGSPQAHPIRPAHLAYLAYLGQPRRCRRGGYFNHEFGNEGG